MPALITSSAWSRKVRALACNLQRDAQPVALQTWASELLEQILPLAELLDQNQGGNAHRQALQAQQAKVVDASLTPSAQVLAQLQQGLSFTEFAMRQSKLHAEYFRSQPLSAEQQAASKPARLSHCETRPS